MAALREIIASFGFEIDKEGNLPKADKRIDGLTQKLVGFGEAAIAAFAVDKVLGFGKALLDDADALAKQSEALGISTAQLQGWEHAAQLSGSSAEEFVAAFTKFTRNVNEASDSAAGPAAKAFKALGVAIKDSSGKLGQPIDLLDGVVAGLQNIQDPAKRTALVMDLFGKSGARLLPLLSEGPEGLKKLRAEVEELGASFDDAFLENAQEFNDNIDRMKLGVRGLAMQIIGPILPGLVRLTAGAIQATKGFMAWVKQTTFVRTALSGLSIKGVMSLASAIPKLLARFGGLSAILGRAALFAARFVAPLLLLDDAIGFFEGDDSVIGTWVDKAFGAGSQDKVRAFFGLLTSSPDKARSEFKKFADSTEWGKDSFMRGWNDGLLEEALFVSNALTGGWTNFVNKAKVAGQGLMLALKIVWTEVKFFGLSAAAALSDGFDAVWNGIVSGAQAALNAMIDVLAKLPGTTDAVKGLRESVKSLDSAKGSGDARQVVGRQHDRESMALANEYDRIGALATAPASSVPAAVTNNNVQQTVAPVTNVQVVVEGGGSSADVGNRVGKATAKATSEINTRALKAALVPTPG